MYVIYIYLYCVYIYYSAYACAPDIYQDNLYEYKLKNITKPKNGTNDEDITEEVESSEEALELIQDNGEDTKATVEVIATNEQRPSKRFSTMLSETAENITSTFTNTFITLTGGITEENIRWYIYKKKILFFTSSAFS